MSDKVKLDIDSFLDEDHKKFTLTVSCRVPMVPNDLIKAMISALNTIMENLYGK